MPIETTTLWTPLSLCLGLTLYVFGGLRFRRWAVADRWGVPRFSHSVETVLLWLVYSSAVSIAIIVARQTLRHF
ncbi:MAG: hypothetical protein NXI30_13785 [bacterium]|nr:hypothetical protein [bacterium]